MLPTFTAQRSAILVIGLIRLAQGSSERCNTWLRGRWSSLGLLKCYAKLFTTISRQNGYAQVDQLRSDRLHRLQRDVGCCQKASVNRGKLRRPWNATRRLVQLLTLAIIYEEFSGLRGWAVYAREL